MFRTGRCEAEVVAHEQDEAKQILLSAKRMIDADVVLSIFVLHFLNRDRQVDTLVECELDLADLRFVHHAASRRRRSRRRVTIRNVCCQAMVSCGALVRLSGATQEVATCAWGGGPPFARAELLLPAMTALF